MIQSNQELYQEINIIIKILKSSGNYDFAKKIEESLTISTVPSEVWGKTRLTLESLNSTNLPEQLKIKNKIEDSLDYLNQIL